METTPYRRGFASDNNAGIHPDVLNAICIANQGHTLAYGDDPITESAVKNGADLIVTSCPLCHYNLDTYQVRLAESTSGFRTIPVLYIGQILAILAGLKGLNDFSLHAVDPRPVLRKRGLLA